MNSPDIDTERVRRRQVLADELDELGVPVEATPAQARHALFIAGSETGQRYLADALRIRRERAR
jgi:hypothetical protein